jgi:hypothetical protein
MTTMTTTNDTRTPAELASDATRLSPPPAAPIARRAWIAAQFDEALAEIDPLRAVARMLDNLTEQRTT